MLATCVLTVLRRTSSGVRDLLVGQTLAHEGKDFPLLQASAQVGVSWPALGFSFREPWRIIAAEPAQFPHPFAKKVGP